MNEDLPDLIRQRHSTRDYTDDPVSHDDLVSIIEAGCQAPSSKNNQPWSVIVAEQPALRNIVDKAVRGIALAEPGARETINIINSAPACIFVFLDANSESERYFAHVLSVGAFMENMMLRACSLGLGSLWCGDILYYREEFKNALGSDSPPIAALVIGYENTPEPPKKHKRPCDIIRRWVNEQPLSDSQTY